MRHSLAAFYFALLFAICNLPVFSQNVTITYVNPPDMSVCDTALFEVTVANTLATPLQSVELTAVMPAGLGYVLGSVANATEANTGNPSAPKFSLPNVLSGDSHTFSFRATTQCGLIGPINAGDLFTNTYNLAYSGGTKAVTTLPYIIETGLLQPFSLNSTNMSGMGGDVLTRQWTIINTRLGAISRLVFRDSYGAGVTISSVQGTVLTNLPGLLEVELGPADFQAIGDGDGLLELNEQFTITESILITACGNSQQSVSALSVEWGCHGELCQKLDETATVIIFSGTNNPNVVGNIIATYPTDYCASTGNTQTLELTNIGNLPATNLLLSLTHFGYNTMGLDPTTLTVSIGGNPVAVSPSFSGQVQFSGCTAPLPVYDNLSMVIPSILPGQTAVVQWKSYLCAVQCNDSLAIWGYDFQYAKICPNDISGQESGMSSNNGPNVPIHQFVSFYIGQILEDNGVYQLTYTLKSPLMADSTGIMKVFIDLPCGMSWANNSGFNLAGNTPDSVDVLSSPTDGDDVTLYFTLPMAVDSVGSDFFIEFQCAEECTGPLPPCKIEYFTSCPAASGAGLVGSSQVSVNTTMHFDQSQCGPQDCENFGLLWQCEAATDSICYDTLIGYFNTIHEFHRENLGEPDNNNDRFKDASGSLNENLIRRDRALAGDTVHTHIEGAMNIDYPGGTLPAAALVVNFEAHTADLGWDGGDTLHAKIDKKLMVDGLGFKDLGGTVHIVDVSTGQSYDCDLPTPVALDTLQAQIAVVNTRPEVVVDKWIYLQYQYVLTVQALNQQGCTVPLDFAFEEGDSVIADVFHKTLHNTGSYVANLRTNPNLYAWNPPGPFQQLPFACEGGYTQWQYSGYRYTIGSGQYIMPPCETSSQPGGTYFSFKIGQANFFPYEFRSFAELVDWRYNVPPPATLLSAVFKKLEIQNGIIVSSNIPVNWTQTGNSYAFDVDGLQNPLVDEGFLMEFGHEWALPCTVDEPVNVGIAAVIDFASSIPQSDPTILNVDGFSVGMLFPIRPDLVLTPVNPDFNGFTSTATWDFNFANQTSDDVSADNTWMTVTSTSGLLTDFVLVNTTTGATITPNNGIFQLGDLPQGWQADFQLQANIANCLPDEVILTFGTSCQPFTPSNTDTCANYSQIFTVSPILGELEMDVTSPTPQLFELCDTIPFHEVVVFNAQIGVVTEVLLKAQMPAGMFIMPGSCEIAFPTGTPWIPLPDPVDLGNGLKEWNLSALNAALAASGLTGFDQPPTNSVSVRFRSATECGFVTPSQIVFNATATQSCGVPTNELSKPGLPLYIEGVTPLYQTNITIDATAPPVVECGSSILLEVSMEADATTAVTDSVFVLLPPGLAYLPGSYLPGSNAVAGVPLQDFFNNQFRLKWPMQAGLPPFSTISFSLQLTVLPGGGCDSVAVEIATYQLQTAVCSATGQACSTLAETGSQVLSIGIVLPALALSNLQVFHSNGFAEYSVLLENNGGNSTQSIVVNFYFDADASGSFTPGDPLLDTQTWPGGLQGGATQLLVGSVNLTYGQLCRLIAVVDKDDNCTCSEDVESAVGNIVNVLPPQTVCASSEVEVGIPGQAGHSYQWEPASFFECPTCPTTNFQASELSAPETGMQVVLTLLDDNGPGCAITNSLTITAGGTSISGWGTIFTCEGGTYNYGPPPPGGSQSWSSFQDYENDTANYVITFFEPGNYAQTFIDSFGCYSGIELGVVFEDVLSIDTMNLCNGDSIIVDSVAYFDDFLLCDTSFTSAGCKKIQCVYYQASPGLDIEFPLDTVCTFEGIPVIINTTPGGYAGYSWSGSGLSCYDCPQPTAPAVMETYTVSITDDDGCEVSGEVTVQVLLPCSVGGMVMPNVFSPNGDNVNEYFRPVYMPGVEKIVESAHLRIFDRWGNLVFDGKGVDVKWDGNFNEKPMPSDVYIFLLEMSCSTDEVVLRGDVTLLR